MNIMISGGYRKENRSVYDRIDEKNLVISYVPSWFGKESFTDFHNFKKQFKKSKIKFFPLDLKKDIKDLLSSDIIYFDGGNTFFLLYWIKKLNLLKKLRKFSKNKTIVGMSAGAIIQSKNINLASIPYFNADDNFVNLKNSESLDLFNFEIYPHFVKSNRKELFELIKYSKRNNNRKIYLIPDGSSILKRKNIRVIGKHSILKNGKLIKK